MANHHLEIPTTTNDWNSIWMEKQSLRKADHGADYWNSRAESFTNKDTPGSYTERFLELADIKPGESVFDMGCGTGNLSVPLGRTGHHVLAADFSTNMLSKLEERLQLDGIDDVQTLELSWEDDWAKAGIAPKSFDVCVASRSIATDDLLSALKKLTSVARRRACITLATGTSPRIDDRIIRYLGMEANPCLDDVYAIAILSALGYLPELTYIHTQRDDLFDSADAAYMKYIDMVRMESPEQPDAATEDKVRQWVEGNLDHSGKGYRLKVPRRISWAFISWDV